MFSVFDWMMKRQGGVLFLFLGLLFFIQAITGTLHAFAQDVPIPAQKPVTANESVPAPVPAAVPVPAQKPETQETPAENAAQSPTLLDNLTATLLGTNTPPVPQRKPAVLSQNQSVIEELMFNSKTANFSAPLSDQNAKLYKAVFEKQQDGDFKAADRLLKNINDPRLLGHVLFQRYMHKEYKTSFEELRRWMEYYSDLPEASRIYTLAQNRAPAGYKGVLQKPQIARGVKRVAEPTMRVSRRYQSPQKRSDAVKRQVNGLHTAIYTHIRKDQNAQALQTLNAQGSVLDSVEFDVLQGEIAAGYLYSGDTKMALSLAQKSLHRSGLHVPKAGWVAGLVSWKNKSYARAAQYFEVVARSPYASGWTAAAGSYWAARAHMRTGNVKVVSTWLKRGIAQPRTFYGLISTRALGRDFDFNWKVPTFTKENLEILAKIPAANRAIALIKVGQSGLAEAELVRIQPENDQEHTALLAYADYVNLPGLAMRLAVTLSEPEGAYYDAALYPMGPWQPKEGYTIDPALVNAIMRQESRFDPNALSPSGAKGLMQLMPATANAMVEEEEAELDDPEKNVELGQKYLEDLLNTQVVGGNLLYLLIAYNAGPGNLSKWKDRWKDVEDPLLFIELIPTAETRAYVEKVLANYWIYRLRDGLDTPSLDALTSGRVANYNLKDF